MMNRLFRDMSIYVAAYMDDVVMFSRTWEEHLHHLDETMSRLTQAGLTVKICKCQLQGIGACI